MLPQAASVPTMAKLKIDTSRWSRFMLLIFLEALGALLLLVLIVWWTMFSGRRKGEIEREEQTTQPAKDSD
jgi:cbb3-type cytochrome oxidase subunit 3